MVFVTPRFLSHLLYSPCTPHGVQTHKNIDKPRFRLYSHCEYKQNLDKSKKPDIITNAQKPLVIYVERNYSENMFHQSSQQTYATRRLARALDRADDLARKNAHENR